MESTDFDADPLILRTGHPRLGVSGAPSSLCLDALVNTTFGKSRGDTVKGSEDHDL